VDESGTRYISGKSDNYFVVSAVVVVDEWKQRVIDSFKVLKTELGRHPDHVLHFSKLKKHRRIPAASGMASLSGVATVANIIVCKDRMGEPGPAGDLAYIADPDPMYLWALRLVLERVSWFVKARRGQAIVTFSHLQNMEPQQIHEYRRALEAKADDPDMSIEWEVFKGHDFRVDGPKNIELLQIADTTASSTYHAVQPGADGDKYLRALRPKLYRGYPPLKSAGPITTYGLKVFPAAECKPSAALAFLADF
jgi:hypothetical protein